MLRFRRKKQTEAAVSKSRRTWFGRVATLFQRSRLDEELWDELEELLISADVGVGTTQTLLQRLRDRIRANHVIETQEGFRLLKEEMVAILEARGNASESTSTLDETDEIPLVLLVIGVNGVGKTTTIAKLTRKYTEAGKTVLLGAADTFRAAAVEQLETWGRHLGVDVIAHRHGADPGAVAFDTVQAAKSRKFDVVIIDTAGRLHTKSNLMEELKKIQRVLANQGAASPRVLLVLDATVGQNGLAQARAFTEAFQCDGVFLAKLDGTSKGGVVLAIVQELELPVLYIGSGEQPEDIEIFDAGEFVEGLFTSLDAS